MVEPVLALNLRGGLTAKIKKLIKEIACGCDCLKTVYRFEDNFNDPAPPNQHWFTMGNVAAVDRSRGWWRAKADDANPLSAFVERQRCFAIAGANGTEADPPMALSARIFMVPGPDPTDITHAVAFVDLAHDASIILVVASYAGPLVWLVGVQDGVNPQVFIPLNLPAPATTCPTSQLVRLEVRKTGVLATVNGSSQFVPYSSFPGISVPALTSHLYAIGAAAILNTPGTTGETHLDLVCGSQGNVCLEDPAPSFGSSGDWIQSQSNLTSDDFSTAETVNWDVIQNVSLDTQNNHLIVWVAISSENNTPGELNRFRITVDGTPEPASFAATEFPDADSPQGTAIAFKTDNPVGAGTHIVQLEWQVSGGTGKILAQTKPTEEIASMVVAEVGA